MPDATRGDLDADAPETLAPTSELAARLADRSCERDEDCCVVASACRGEATVVRAAVWDEAEAHIDALPAPEGGCVACSSFRIVVRCISGQCRGTWPASYVARPPYPMGWPIGSDAEEHCGLTAADEALLARDHGALVEGTSNTCR